MSKIRTFADINAKVIENKITEPPLVLTLFLKGRSPSPVEGGGEVPADVASLAKAIEQNESKSKIAEKLKAAVKKLIRMQKMERTRKNRAASVIQRAARRRSARSRARPRTPSPKSPAPSPESDIEINIPEIPINYGGGILYAARASAAAAAAAVKIVAVAAGTGAVAVGTGIVNLAEAIRDDMRRQKEELKELREKQEAEMRKQKELQEEAERMAIENRKAYEKDKARRDRAKQKAEDAKQKAEEAEQAVKVIHVIEDVIDDAVKAPKPNEPNAAAVFFANVGEALGRVYENASVLLAKMDEPDADDIELAAAIRARDMELCRQGQSCSDVMNRSPSVEPALQGPNVPKKVKTGNGGGGGGGRGSAVLFEKERSPTPEDEEHVAVIYGQHPPPRGSSSVVSSKLRQLNSKFFNDQLFSMHRDWFDRDIKPDLSYIKSIASQMGSTNGKKSVDKWYSNLSNEKQNFYKNFRDTLFAEYDKITKINSAVTGGSIRNTRNKRRFNRHTRRY